MVFSTHNWWWEGFAALGWAALLILSVLYYHSNTGASLLVAWIVSSPFGILCGISALRHGPKSGRVAGYIALTIPALFVLAILFSMALS